MRRINYGNKERYIAEEEIPLQKKGINWDRVVYLAVFFMLVISLLVYLADKFLYLKLKGQVVYEKHLVYLPYDSWIFDVYVEEGDYVKKGDSLFLFRPEFNRTGNDLFNSIQSVEAGKENNLANAQRNLLIKKTEFDQNLKLISSYEEKIEEIKLMVLLDANNSERINSYQIEIDKLLSKNEVLQAEIKFWGDYISSLPQRAALYQENLTKRISDLNETEIYYSTGEGYIDRLNFHSDELVYKRQPVLDLIQKDLFALCYLPKSEFGILLEKDEVDLTFANGDHAKGLVKVIFANLDNIPSKYLISNSASSENFLVVIEPLSSDDRTLWKSNINQRVKATKKRLF